MKPIPHARWRFILRLLWRDSFTTEWRLLWLALAIAMAAMASSSFFEQRVKEGMRREAASLLAADLVVIGDHRLPADYRLRAEKLGLQIAETVQFPTMAQAPGGGNLLVSLKAVDNAYPLRGQLQLAGTPPHQPPRRGTIWVEDALLQRLGLHIGDAITLGDARFTIADRIVREPDQSLSFFSLGPRVLIHQQDLARTGLLVEGARARYRLLLAGDAAALQQFQTQITPRLLRGERLETLETGRPELKEALRHSRQYLALTALTGVALAAGAILLAARQYAARHLNGAALMIALGASRGQVLRLVILQLLGAWLLALLPALAIGLALQGPLVTLLLPEFAAQLPPPDMRSAGLIALAGLVLLLGMCWPQLEQLYRTPVLRVLRQELQPPTRSSLLVVPVSLATVYGLAWLQSQQADLAAYAIAGLLGLMLLALGAAASLIWLIGKLRRHVPLAWRLALAGLDRHRALTLLQVVCLAIAACALLTLSLTRQQLLSNWQASLPSDAPNHYLFNIQPDQRAGIQQQLAPLQQPVHLQAMVRGRLVAVNGQAFSGRRFTDERARNLAEREFNLSSQPDMPPDNRLLAGHWWHPGEAAWSVEEGLAKTLGLQRGDRLTFDIAGTQVTAPITSVRKVRWDSFRVNFFVLASPGLIDRQPASFITAVHIPQTQARRVDALLATYPNVTVVDVSAMLAQVRQLLTRVSQAVEYLFGFSLAAGIAVLLTTLSSASQARRREIALLRTLGASRRQVLTGLLTELLLTGILAGALAGLAANLAGWGMSQLLNLPWNFSIAAPLLGMGAVGLLVVMCAGPWAWRLLSTAPAAILRQT